MVSRQGRLFVLSSLAFAVFTGNAVAGGFEKETTLFSDSLLGGCPRIAPVARIAKN